MTYARRQVLQHRVISADIVNGKFEVVRKYPSHMAFCSGDPVPDLVEKETYIVGVNGQIELESVIQGFHKPAHTVPEKIEFKE